MKNKKLFSFLIFWFFLFTGFAVAYITAPVSTVTRVGSYNQFGNGDVTFSIANPIQECSDGYWFTKSDPGFQANLSMVIAAHQTKTPVIVTALPEQMWSGSSSGKFCKLYVISLQ